MQRKIAVAACFWALLSPAAFAQSPIQDLEPTAVSNPYLTTVLPAPVSVTDITAAVPNAAHTCRRAWRCGPYDCGWRQICGRANWRPFWRTHHSPWRRHQWRRHYW